MLRSRTLEERRTLPQDSKSQSDKFEEAAREVEADTNEKRWEERLKKIAKPGLGRNVGDRTPNPLPDDPSGCESDEGGGDAGRT